MKGKHPVRGFIAFIMFVVIVAATGYALVTAGYIDDPFQNLAYMSSFGSGNGGFDNAIGPSDAEAAASNDVSINDLMASAPAFELPALDGSDSSTTDAALPQPAHREQGGMDWSSIGDVLYDWWFIAATTVVFIIVQFVFKFSTRQFKTQLATR